MKTIEFVKQRGLGWEILNSYGFYKTGNKHIDCPICGGKKKFRLSEYNGHPSWICVCGNGDMWSLLVDTQSLTFAEIAKSIDERYGNTHTNHLSLDCAKLKPKQENNLLMPHSTCVEKYLRGRGITVLPEYSVYCKEKQYHRETGKEYSCMHSIAVDHAMNQSMIHQTYIDGGKKISSESAKKMFKLSDSQNIAVRLFPVETALGVGEGVENSLSAHQLYSMPVWSTLSSALMKRFRAPRGVKHLYIFADYEPHGTGIAAATHCANANLLCRNDVIKATIRWSEAGDFNNVLNNPGSQVFELNFHR